MNLNVVIFFICVTFASAKRVKNKGACSSPRIYDVPSPTIPNHSEGDVSILIRALNPDRSIERKGQISRNPFNPRSYNPSRDKSHVFNPLSEVVRPNPIPSGVKLGAEKHFWRSENKKLSDSGVNYGVRVGRNPNSGAGSKNKCKTG